MSGKMTVLEENSLTLLTPTKMSVWRLIIDQARMTPEVRHYHYDGAGSAESPYVVTWIENDTGNPMNWSMTLKWCMTMAAATSTLAVAFASTAYSGAVHQLEAEFHASIQLISAGISLFVLGFALGPLCWAPLSEQYGRQIIFVITFLLFTLFNAGCVGANNITTMLVLRFLAGSFGSSPLTNAGGIIADIFPASQRGLAMNMFAIAPSLGPCLGPFIGGFLGAAAGWRWVMGFVTIFTACLWMIQSLIIPETYAPVLLRKRAAALSRMTGYVYMTKHDIQKGPLSIKDILLTTLTRPWILLFLEPIVLILSVYVAIVYGTLYMLFGAFPIVFQEGRGWNEGVGGLAFLGVAIGMLCAIAMSPFFNRLYAVQLEKNGGVAPPEARLIAGMVGGVAVPVGMFWFAWTNSPSVPWISSVAAGAPFGFGFCLIFLSVQMYLIDSYTIFAASVLAANTVLRSLFGAAFPLFTADMYDNLGIHWASSIPAFLALACAPFPFILYRYGAAIRRRTIYAAQAEAAMNDLRAKAVAVEGTREDLSTVTESSTDSPANVEKGTSLEFLDSRPALFRTTSGTGSVIEAAGYEANPYDIDRDMTSTSMNGLELTRTRTNPCSISR